jgi:hypothetical protein
MHNKVYHTVKTIKDKPPILDTPFWAILGEISLKPGEPDRRSLLRCRKKCGALDAAALYKLRTWGGVHAPFHDFVWLNHAPSKVQFFGWLLSRGRLQTRATLHEKTILTRAEAGCPICLASIETADHLLLGCGFAGSFWAAIGQRFPDHAKASNMYAYPGVPRVPPATSSTFTLLCCWNLWKHRNGVVFREQRASIPLLLKMCRDDARLWRVRLPQERAADVDAWLRCTGVT